MPDDPTRSIPVEAATADEASTRDAGMPSGEPLDCSNTPPGYELLDSLGEGGMGIVFRAREVTLDRDVAVKLLQPHYPPAGPAARRFLEEARITGQLQHPGIPPIHQVGTLPDGRPFLAMKLIKGRTLDELLKQRSRPSAERGRFLAVFEQVCQAVGYAHAHHVVHRDLKPANVMVGAFGEVQVMDWGLAKIVPKTDFDRRAAAVAEADLATIAYSEIRSTRDRDDATHAGSILGTPAFMPPEQAIGAIDQIDERSDVFGLGAILCVVLTGKPPYQGADSESTRQLAARSKLDDAFTRLDACAAEPELVALCKRCLATETTDRPPDAGAVATAVARLRAAAEERAKQAELDRAKAEVHIEEQRKRRKVQLALAGAIAFALLAVIGGLAAYLISQSRANAELRAANERETAALQEEAKARGEAEENFDLAFRAVEDYLLKMSEDDRLNEEDLFELRRNLALSAKDFFTRFIERSRGDPKLALALGRACYRLGSLHDTLGEYPAAADYFREAIRVLTPLADAEDAAPEPQLILSRASIDLGDLYTHRLRRFEEAQRVLTDAEPRLKRLVERYPAGKQHRHEEFRLVKATGGLWEEQGHLDRAEPYYQRALVLQRQLAVDFPDADTRARVAHYCAEYGRLLRNQNRGEEARKVIEEGLRIAEEVARAAPRNYRNRQELSYLHDELARVFQNLRLVEKQEEQSRKSLTIARELVNDFPGRVSTQYRLANALEFLSEVLTNTGRTEEAFKLSSELVALVERLERITAGAPNYRQLVASGYYQHARTLHRLGKYEEGEDYRRRSVALSEKLWQEFPHVPDYGLKLGIHRSGLVFLLVQTSRYKEAWEEGQKTITVFEELIARYPSVAEHRFRLAELCANVNAAARVAVGPEAEEAVTRKGIAALEPLLAKNDNPRYRALASRLHDDLGVARAQANDHEKAAAAFLEAIRLDAKNPTALPNLVAVFRKKKDDDGLIAVLRELLKANPDAAPIHLQLGVQLHNVKRDYDGAEAAFREFIRLEPKNAVGPFNLANTHLVRKDLDGAIAGFRDAINLNPKYSEAHLRLARTLKQKRDAKGAAAAFGEYVKLVPTSVEGHFELGAALYAAGQVKESVLAFEKVIELDPKVSAAYNELAIALVRLGDLDGSVKALRDGLTIAPKDAQLQKNLEIALKLKADRDAKDGRVAPPPREVMRP